MFCSSCGSNIEDGIAECPSCGARTVFYKRQPIAIDKTLLDKVLHYALFAGKLLAITAVFCVLYSLYAVFNDGELNKAAAIFAAVFSLIALLVFLAVLAGRIALYRKETEKITSAVLLTVITIFTVTLAFVTIAAAFK